LDFLIFYLEHNRLKREVTYWLYKCSKPFISMKHQAEGWKRSQPSKPAIFKLSWITQHYLHDACKLLLYLLHWRSCVYETKGSQHAFLDPVISYVAATSSCS
jgi:hypothetical protein